MKRPRGALAPQTTRALFAIMGGAHTVQAAADALDVSRSTAYQFIKRLHREGLVTWELKRSGTLHATVGFVYAGDMTEDDGAEL